MENKTNFCNITKSIEEKLGKNIYKLKNHPIEIVKNEIYKYFTNLKNYKFNIFEDLSPFVSVEDNFDKLLIPKDHPARSKSDTYYLNENTVLRTHTSAHQNELLLKGNKCFIVAGDVYRKDEIDRYHYPVFHQIEGVVVFDKDNQDNQDNQDKRVNLEKELKFLLSGLVEHLFPNCEYRFNDDYFPFTHPSFEIEVKYMDKWMEILGCGVMRPEILENCGMKGCTGIAFGLGLERITLKMFDIPDIRYIWSNHSKFLDQFTDGKIVKFKPFSKVDNIHKDISFWINDNKINNDKWIEENDFYEIIRELSNDMIEKVDLLDKFYHEKKNKHSRTFRIIYSSNDPSLTSPSIFNETVNKYQENIRKIISERLQVELR